MPAKKAASQSSDMGMVWKWVYTVGAVVAAVAGALAFKNDILTWVLILAGVLVGWFYFDPEELEHFGLRYLVLFAVQAVLTAVPAVGGYITGFFGGLVMFIGPVVLTMAAHFFWNKRIASLF
jgi:hypothetical protein